MGKNSILLLSFVFLLCACSGNDGQDIVSTDKDYINISSVRLTGGEVVSTDDEANVPEDIVSTRAYPNGSSTRYNVEFEYDDSVGIFPEGDYQIAFRIPVPNKTDRLGSSDILSEGWATKTGINYVAYLPFSFPNRSGNRVPWDYREIQHQCGNDNRDSISKYWFLASEPVNSVLTDEGKYSIRATLNNYGAIMRVYIRAPKAGSYKRIMVVAPWRRFATHGTFDLFDTSAPIVSGSSRDIPYLHQPFTAADSTDHVTLDLYSITRDANAWITGLIVIPETDLRNLNMTAYLWDEDDNVYMIQRQLTGNLGKYYRGVMSNLTFNGTPTPVTNIDVKVNDWEKEELCPTCTPVAW